MAKLLLLSFVPFELYVGIAQVVGNLRNISL